MPPKPLTPVNSPANPVLKASGLVLTLAVVMGIAAFRFHSATALVALPTVLIVGIALAFGTPLFQRGRVLLTIDEDGVFDRRSMKEKIAWADIDSVEEKAFRTRSGIVIYVTFVLKLTNGRQISIAAAGLEYSTEGLRDTFRQVRTIGLLKP